MALLSSACILGTSRLKRGQPNYEAARLRSQGRQSDPQTLERTRSNSVVFIGALGHATTTIPPYEAT